MNTPVTATLTALCAGVVIAGGVALAVWTTPGAAPMPTHSGAAAAADTSRTADTIAWQVVGDGRTSDAATWAPNVYYSATGSDPRQPDQGRRVVSGLPFSQSTTVTHRGYGEAMVEAFGAPGEPVSCSITVNGTEVAHQSGGGSALCSWSGSTPG